MNSQTVVQEIVEETNSQSVTRDLAEKITDEMWEDFEGACCAWCRLNGHTYKFVTQIEGRILGIDSKLHNKQLALAFCNLRHSQLWLGWFYSSPIVVADWYVQEYIQEDTQTVVGRW